VTRLNFDTTKQCHALIVETSQILTRLNSDTPQQCSNRLRLVKYYWFKLWHDQTVFDPSQQYLTQLSHDSCQVHMMNMSETSVDTSQQRLARPISCLTRPSIHLKKFNCIKHSDPSQQCWHDSTVFDPSQQCVTRLSVFTCKKEYACSIVDPSQRFDPSQQCMTRVRLLGLFLTRLKFDPSQIMT